MKKLVKTLLAAALLASLSGLSASAQSLPEEKIVPKTIGGTTVNVYYRKGLSPTAVRARSAPHKTETMILKKGSIRREGAKPLSCDILFEKDVPVTLRDHTIIYTDVFRPVDQEKHPALMAWSPYGKEIGGQWLDDVPGRSGVPTGFRTSRNSKVPTPPTGWPMATPS